MEDTKGAVKLRRIELPTYMPSFPHLTSDEYLQLVRKKIIFVRHAESIYQISDLSYGEKCVNMSFRDAKLSEKGRAQACTLGAVLEREVGLNSVDLVVCSGLSRSMQTTALSFGSRSGRTIYVNACFAEKVDSWSDVERDLEDCLEEHVELRGFQWHKTRSRRCTLADGSPMAQRWNIDRGYPLERDSTAMDRIKRCWQWLSDRKEETIAVITHSKLLGREHQAYGLLNFDPTISMSKFDNVEVAIMTLDKREVVLALPAPPELTPSRHAIVVLGHALNNDTSPNEILKDRIKATVDTFNLHKQAAVEAGSLLLPRIIVSGGDAAQVGLSEAVVMKRMLIEAGIPDKLIIEENISLNTCQNAWYVGSIVKSLGITGLTLVTSEFHMPRSQYVFEAVLRHLCLYHIDCAPVSAESASAMESNRLTPMYIEHIRNYMEWEKQYIIEGLEKIFLERHIPNIKITPLGADRLQKAILDIELVILLHKKRYGL